MTDNRTPSQRSDDWHARLTELMQELEDEMHANQPQGHVYATRLADAAVKAKSAGAAAKRKSAPNFSQARAATLARLSAADNTGGA